MGVMVDGRWERDSAGVPTEEGDFVRAETTFRNFIAPDGEFPPESGRYHLYVSWACPWAHRTIIFRKLKGLEAHIGLSATHWLMGEEGWTFEVADGVIPDPLGAHALHEVYARADPHYTGRVNVPVLYDLKTNRIVSNESADIIRIFNSAFDQLGAAAGDYYPEALREEIDALNERIYATVNNGVYRAGFAKTQQSYDAAVAALFETLDWLEERLSGCRFLFGETLTEADWRLFTTLIRFDAVYYIHFKCNIRALADYPALWEYTKRLLEVQGVAETVKLYHIKHHYYLSHPWIDPTGIVPLDFEKDVALLAASAGASHQPLPQAGEAHGESGFPSRDRLDQSGPSSG
jgi:glutathionyl-hydroquinone reductase